MIMRIYKKANNENFILYFAIIFSRILFQHFTFHRQLLASSAGLVNTALPVALSYNTRYDAVCSVLFRMAYNQSVFPFGDIHSGFY